MHLDPLHLPPRANCLGPRESMKNLLSSPSLSVALSEEKASKKGTPKYTEELINGWEPPAQQIQADCLASCKAQLDLTLGKAIPDSILRGQRPGQRFPSVR